MKLFIRALLLACFLLTAHLAAASTGLQPRPSENQLLPDEAALPFDLRDVKAASIEVYKAERRMDLLDKRGNPIRSYHISLGKTPVGDKKFEGDGKTPEGKYIIDARNERSNFHLSLRISYPNPSDMWRAKKDNAKPGGNIFIHGLPNGKGWKLWKYRKGNDWTDGCIAVYNHEIKEIWHLVQDGTPIIIRP